MHADKNERRQQTYIYVQIYGKHIFKYLLYINTCHTYNKASTAIVADMIEEMESERIEEMESERKEYSSLTSMMDNPNEITTKWSRQNKK